MVVADIEAARAELVERGVDVSEVQVFPWGSFVFFSDPDGNGWAVQAASPAPVAMSFAGPCGLPVDCLPRMQGASRAQA